MENFSQSMKQLPIYYIFSSFPNFQFFDAKKRRRKQFFVNQKDIEGANSS